MRPGDRTEHQDQNCQAEGSGEAVFQQLQPDVVRAELLGHDPGPDDNRHQQTRPEQLRQQAAEEVGSGSGGRGGHVHILTATGCLSQD